MKNCFSVFCLLVSVSLGVNATCYTSDLKGTWYLNGTSGNVYYGTYDETDRCKLSVSSTGSISASGSSCDFRDSDGYSQWPGSVTGKLAVTSACNVSGYIKVCASGECGYIKIERSKMDRSKNIMAMIYYVDSSPDDVGHFTAIKQ